MAELADAFVMAPGGAGSLEEFSRLIVGRKLAFMKNQLPFII